MDMEQLLNHPDIFQYKIIRSEEIPFSAEVHEECKENRCGRYGSCWTCPPGAGGQKELEEKIKKFTYAAVFTCRYELEDESDEEGRAEGSKATQGVLLELADELRNEDVEFLPLGCEGCHICTKCNYPATACRFPERALLAVKACGIPVKELAERAGLAYSDGPEEITYICVILF